MSGKTKRSRGRPRKTGDFSDRFGQEVANKLIEAIRQETGCLQDGLEKRYKLPRSTISNIVTGNGVLTVRTLKLILSNFIRDEEVSTDAIANIVKMVGRMSIERTLVSERVMFELQAQMRRRKFEQEERKLREKFDLQIRKIEEILHQ